MTTRQAAGQIFLGVTPRPMRSYLLERFREAKDKHQRLVLPCSGRFTDAETAVNAGWDPARIEASDISLFSSLIGYRAAGKSTGALGVRFSEFLADFQEYVGTPLETAAVMLGLKVCQLNQNNNYDAEIIEELLTNRANYLNQMFESTEGLINRLKGINYEIRDVLDHWESGTQDPNACCYVSPPGYCLAQHQRILTADLRWVACGDLKVGDEILAFDEHVPDGHRLRRWRWGTVTRSDPMRVECVRVHLENGESIVCTPDHPWLTNRYSYVLGHRDWVPASELMMEPYGHRKARVGQCISKGLTPWSRADSFDAGWLSGMFDGEGYISLAPGDGSGSCNLAIAQKEGPILDRALYLLREHGFKATVYSKPELKTAAVDVQGGFPEVLRALGTYAPQRLLANLRKADISRQSLRAPNGTSAMVQVMEVEPIGLQDIQSITTSTATYVGEGYLMHNSKGYEKMFDTKGAIKWAQPSIPEFDYKAGRPKIYNMTLAAKGLAFVQAAWDMTDYVGDRIVFYWEGPAHGEYLACNRSDEVEHVRIFAKETEIRPAKIPLMPIDYEIREDSKVSIVQTKREHALYYRDLFAHKLGVTRSESYYLMLIDGYIFGVFGMFFDKVTRGQLPQVSETFGFNVPSNRYPRLNRLLMTVLVSQQTRSLFKTLMPSALLDVEFFQTTCIATTPEVKANRGLLKIVERYQRPDGRWYINYRTPFHPWDWQGAVKKWLGDMKRQEQATGRNLTGSGGEQRP
jgi:hypothetical protein